MMTSALYLTKSVVPPAATNEATRIGVEPSLPFTGESHVEEHGSSSKARIEEFECYCLSN